VALRRRRLATRDDIAKPHQNTGRLRAPFLFQHPRHGEIAQRIGDVFALRLRDVAQRGLNPLHDRLELRNFNPAVVIENDARQAACG
jgi:hypothetical protein